MRYKINSVFSGFVFDLKKSPKKYDSFKQFLEQIKTFRFDKTNSGTN